MRTLLVLIAATVMLSGCMGRSPDQRFAEAQNACTGYGFRPGTDNYANCMMQLDAMMIEQDASRRQAMAAALNDYAERNRSVTCNTSASVQGGYGNSAYGHSTTTCR